MRIGEASRASGVPERMIRHYEKLGLIPPPSRGTSGYRAYTDDDVRRLSFVAHARGLGFAMERIVGLMKVWRAGDAALVVAEWNAEAAGKAMSLRIVHEELDAIGAGRAEPVDAS